MAKETKQVRIWKDLDIEGLAKKLSYVLGIEITQTQAVSLAVQNEIARLGGTSIPEAEPDAGREKG